MDLDGVRIAAGRSRFARHRLLPTLAFAVLVLCLASAPAQAAHAPHHKQVRQAVPAEASSPCTIRSLPEFMDEGEFAISSSIADIVQVSCEAAYAEQPVTISSEELLNRCGGGLSWAEPPNAPATTGSSFTELLDNDGNATAVLWGGPSCAAGESLVTAELDIAPYTTVTTGFTVLPPAPSVEAMRESRVRAEPESAIESEETSSTATVIEVAFPPVFAGRPVVITARELESRCGEAPRLLWEGADEIALGSATPEARVTLDNDGHAFVIAEGGPSCASGSSLIEASLVEAPYTTVTTSFTVLAPMPGLEFTV